MIRQGTAAVAVLLSTTLALVVAPEAVAADVNKAPVSYLTGPMTDFNGPKAVAVDDLGLRYVVASDDSIAVFAPTATGDAAPIRVISGNATGIRSLDGIAVDDDGYFYVSDTFGTSQILVFAPGATGDVAPVRVISGPSTQLAWPRGLAVDDNGRLYAANSDSDTITVFAPGAIGNASPLRAIKGPDTGLDYPVGIALTGDDAISVANNLGDSITTYAPGSTGNAVPSRTISGPTTGLLAPWELASDAGGNVYSINWVGTHSVSVFPPTADGDVAPAVRLTGSQTDLGTDSRPGIEVDQDGQVLVTDRGTNVLLTYATLLTPSSAVRSLKVAGASSGTKRTVTWKAPASAGGGAVTSYLVKVTAKGKTLLSKTVGASTLKLVIKKAQLKVGKDTVSVQARNPYGLSAKQSVTFKVAR